MPVPLVRVSGARELTAALRTVDRQLPRQLTAVHKDVARLVAQEGKRRVPVGPTGRLQRSIRPGATQRGAVVRAGNDKVPYAGPIHWGWPARGIAPNTFLLDALDARAAQAVTAYLRGVPRRPLTTRRQPMAVGDDFIDIVHSETHGTGRVHPDAFDLVWKDLGWKKASDKTVAEEEQKAQRAAARREG
jgi:hypothetical protein